MRIQDLDTPAIVIDLDIMERNLDRVASYSRQHGLRLRPHTKTHKIPALGRKQIELGAVGLTVAKTGEAQVMLAADPPDLLVAYPVIGRAKLERLMQVAERTKVTVAVDNLTSAGELSAAAVKHQREIGILAEIDVGLGRVGVPPGEAVGLCREIQKLPNLNLLGITFYPGHVKRMDEAGLAALRDLGQLLEKLVNDLSRNNIPTEIVSGGSTPALWHGHEVKGMNEIRPGTYIFNDWNTVLTGACTLADCAAAVLTTVVSTPRPGHMIIDGGSKTFLVRPAGHRRRCDIRIFEGSSRRCLSPHERGTRIRGYYSRR
jgi:D-serine deaminase-like pyridoxal phosphate-dependent protein